MVLTPLQNPQFGGRRRPMAAAGDGNCNASLRRRWWWWGASAAQLAVGVVCYKRGCGDAHSLMPFKAFAVASLFVGAGAAAVAGALRSHGITKVDDLKEVGAGVRKGLGIPPRRAA